MRAKISVVALGMALGTMLVTGNHAMAATMPYANIGSPATYVPIYASVSGDLVGTMTLPGGGGEDLIRLFDETTKTYSGYGLDNRGTAAGGTFDFGHVNAGDLLSFEIWNSDDQKRLPGLISSTDSSLSQDGVTHAYVTSDGTNVYLDMEDLSLFNNGYTDYNYSDLEFSLPASQVSTGMTTVTPEPSSLALLGTGLLGVLGAARRRFAR